MNNEKIFVIGDIHGCLDMLNKLLNKIPWRPQKDRLIFLGDYIDRGEDSKGVVDYILALKDCSPKVDLLMGNHEAMFLEFLNNEDGDHYIRNGGWSTLKSYRQAQKTNGDQLVPEDHLAFYRSLKLYIELEDYYVVHAGFEPRVHMNEQTEQSMIWIRDSFIYSDYDFGKKIIFGHTPLEEPLVTDNKIGLDTAAVYGNKLTCLELPNMNFYYVRAQ